MWCFNGNEMPDARHCSHSGAAEEVGESISPCQGKERIVLGPENPGVDRDSLERIRRPFDEAAGNRPGACAIPPDRSGEGSAPGVDVGQPVERSLRLAITGSSPVRPEMPKVLANRRAVAVDERFGELKLVERLIPELALSARAQHAVADSGQGRTEHDGPKAARCSPGHRLGDPAADVGNRVLSASAAAE